MFNADGGKQSSDKLLCCGIEGGLFLRVKTVAVLRLYAFLTLKWWLHLVPLNWQD